MTTNYHTHTYRCGHASGTEREYVEKAIELGFKELGFSEHAPMPFPKEIPTANMERLLSMRLKMSETEAYFNTLTALRAEYQNDIKIHIGLETEYFDCCFDAFLDYIKDYPLDYLILGQHFGDPMVEPMVHNGVRTGSEGILKNYVDTVVKAIETDKITYVAHPDLIFYCRSMEIYEREITRLIESANAHQVPLEINFYGLQEIRNYPTLAFWQIANAIGCDVVKGSDAHKPENLLNPYAVKHADMMLRNFKNLRLLDKIEFKPL